MNFPAAPDIRRILILKEDRFSADTLRRMAQQIFPEAHCDVVQRIAAASAIMAAGAVDLWLTGAAALDGDVLDFLAVCCAARNCFRHVLVVTSRHEPRTLLSLRQLPIDGVFDLVEEEPDRLLVALRSIVAGRPYWSPGVLARLQDHLLAPRAFSKLLSAREQMVLSVIGTGIDDQAAAARLGLQPSSVHSVRRRLHRKLGLQHKGDLVRVAVQQGFIRFTADSVLHPGLTILRAQCTRGRRSQGKFSGYPAAIANLAPTPHRAPGPVSP
ncbi:MAG TPA: LuxR C-terminal-related transcriptional regulator [Opitutaceae bacterium]|nr:LuxR C-terminal-related transcriptional regulator [Opitutaceae bacterium]